MIISNLSHLEDFSDAARVTGGIAAVVLITSGTTTGNPFSATTSIVKDGSSEPHNQLFSELLQRSDTTVFPAGTAFTYLSRGIAGAFASSSEGSRVFAAAAVGLLVS